MYQWSVPSLFSAKIFDLAIQYLLIATTALLKKFMFMFRHSEHLVTFRKRSWSWFDTEKLRKDTMYLLTFNQNHNLSLILTKVFLLNLMTLQTPVSCVTVLNFTLFAVHKCTVELHSLEKKVNNL